MRKFTKTWRFWPSTARQSRCSSPTAGGRIAVSGKYQARVMTSAVEPHGASLGFVNRSFIDAGKTGTAFDNYGGEDRFWLGPEGGQYALYFPRRQAVRVRQLANAARAFKKANG